MQQQAQALVDEWTKTFNAARITDLARFYSQDARVVPPGGSVLVGAQAICPYFAGIHAQGFGHYAVNLGDVLEKHGCLVASGRWALRGPDGGGPHLYWGNCLYLLEQGPTGWLIAVQMWN